MIRFSGLKADFSGAVLAGANLGEAVAAEANFSRTNLTAANLGGADLRGAVFAEAVLTGTRFARADLREADFEGAILTGVDFRTAQGLTRAQLAKACGDAATRLPNGVEIRECGRVNVRPPVRGTPDTAVRPGLAPQRPVPGTISPGQVVTALQPK